MELSLTLLVLQQAQDSKVGSIQLEQLGFMVGKTLYSGNYYYS